MPARKGATRKSVSKKTSTTRQSSSAKKRAPKVASGNAKKSGTLSKGDHVTWTTSQGETHGVVEKKLTTPIKIKEHKVSASADNPEYLVRSDKSGDVAAHKPGSLRKTAGKKAR